MFLARFWRCGICKHLFIVKILHPFPNIPEHVVQPPGIWLFCTNALWHFATNYSRSLDILPGYVVLGAGAGGIFPFKLRGQSVTMLWIKRIQFADEGLCITPLNSFDWLVCRTVVFESGWIAAHYFCPLFLRYFIAANEVGMLDIYLESWLMI